MTMMTAGQKAAHFGVIALGTIEAPLLKMLDDKMIEKALQQQKYATALHYPMYYRTSIVIPLVTGLPALVLGFVGDKIAPNMKESTQLYLLEYGAAATVGGLVQIINLMNERQKAGIPMVFPNGQQQAAQRAQAAQAAQAAPRAAVPAVGSAALQVRPLIVP